MPGIIAGLFAHFGLGHQRTDVQHGPRVFQLGTPQQHGGNHEDRGAHPQDRMKRAMGQKVGSGIRPD